MNPLVSIVWNSSGNVQQQKKSIISVLEQNYNNLELIICLDIYEKYKNIIDNYDVELILINHHSSITEYRNDSIKKASGKYISFLSSPNYYSIDKTRNQVDYLENNSLISGLLGSETKVDENGNVLILPSFVETDPDYIKCILQDGYYVPLDSMIFLRNRLIEGNCLFDNTEHSEKNFIVHFASSFLISGIQGECLFSLYEPKIKSLPSNNNNNNINHSFISSLNEYLSCRNKKLCFLKNKSERRKEIIFSCNFLKISDMPLVSVVIPTHNRCDRIVQAIESVVNQTYKNTEIIIVDDCSTDSTNNIIKNYIDNNIANNHKIRYYRLNKNGGPAKARNFGVNMAEGKYIAFLDDDDEWLYDKLSLQMFIMTKDISIDMTFGQMARYERDNLINVAINDLDWYNLKNNFFQEELLNNYVGAPTIVIKKEKFIEIGGFDESIKALEDWEFAIRSSKKLKLEFINSPLIDVNVSHDSVTYSVKNNIEAIIYIVNKNYKYAENQAYYMLIMRKHLRDFLKQSTRQREDLFYVKNNVPAECFTSDLAKELFFDTDEVNAYLLLDKLNESKNTLNNEVINQNSRNEELMKELSAQSNRNEELMKELSAQYNRNDEIMEELRNQYAKNDKLLDEILSLKKQEK